MSLSSFAEFPALANNEPALGFSFAGGNQRSEHVAACLAYAVSASLQGHTKVEDKEGDDIGLQQVGRITGKMRESMGF
ncbi:MAG: hypothetical protein HXO07_08100 [Prevotella salivae]|nr:hypothetical protein [Segatella salivae]